MSEYIVSAKVQDGIPILWHWFPMGAIPKYHDWVAHRTKMNFTTSFGGQKSKVSAGLVRSEAFFLHLKMDCLLSVSSPGFPSGITQP